MRRLPRLTLAALAATITSVLGAGAAIAAPLAIPSVSVPSSRLSAIRAFWTPMRMLAAGGAETGSEVPPNLVAAVDAVDLFVPWWHLPSTAVMVTRQDAGTRAIGRVFARRPDGRIEECSGVLVASANRSTVITAGHCVAWAHQWYTNVAFVPDYQPSASGASAPYGIWPAVYVATTPQWLRGGSNTNWRHDTAAFVVARNSAGEAIAAAIGASQRIAFGASPTLGVTIFGYPAAPPYDGQHLWRCGPREVGRPLVLPSGPGPLPFGMSCAFTPGASGGPWLWRVNRSGIGTVVCVTSSGDAHRREFGAFLDSVAKRVYELISRHPA